MEPVGSNWLTNMRRYAISRLLVVFGFGVFGIYAKTQYYFPLTKRERDKSKSFVNGCYDVEFRFKKRDIGYGIWEDHIETGCIKELKRDLPFDRTTEGGRLTVTFQTQDSGNKIQFEASWGYEKSDLRQSWQRRDLEPNEELRTSFIDGHQPLIWVTKVGRWEDVNTHFRQLISVTVKPDGRNCCVM